jgi:hypothetical protein
LASLDTRSGTFTPFLAKVGRPQGVEVQQFQATVAPDGNCTAFFSTRPTAEDLEPAGRVWVECKTDRDWSSTTALKIAQGHSPVWSSHGELYFIVGMALQRVRQLSRTPTPRFSEPEVALSFPFAQPALSASFGRVYDVVQSSDNAVRILAVKDTPRRMVHLRRLGWLKQALAYCLGKSCPLSMNGF